MVADEKATRDNPQIGDLFRVFRMATFRPATRKYATFHALRLRLLFVVSLPDTKHLLVACFCPPSVVSSPGSPSGENNSIGTPVKLAMKQSKLAILMFRSVLTPLGKKLHVIFICNSCNVPGFFNVMMNYSTALILCDLSIRTSTFSSVFPSLLHPSCCFGIGLKVK